MRHIKQIAVLNALLSFFAYSFHGIGFILLFDLKQLGAYALAVIEFIVVVSDVVVDVDLFQG